MLLLALVAEGLERLGLTDRQSFSSCILASIAGREDGYSDTSYSVDIQVLDKTRI